MREFYKTILNDFKQLTVMNTVVKIIDYSDNFSFLAEKIFEERELLDYQYIKKNSVIPMQTHILEANKMLQNFLFDKNHKTQIPIQYYEYYEQYDLNGISFSLYILYVRVNNSLASLHVIDDNNALDLNLHKDLIRLQSLDMFKHINSYSRKIAFLCQHYYPTPIRLINQANIA